MTTWARIDVSDDTIKELFPFDPSGVFAEDPDFRFQAVPTDVEGWVSTDWIMPVEGLPTPPDINVLLNEAITRLENIRWEKQTQGIVVFDNLFLSDPPNLSIISGAIQGAQVKEAMMGAGTFVATWKSETGPVQLDLNGLLTVGLFGMSYTQACFDREIEITSALKAIANAEGDVASKVVPLIEAYNANAELDWPSNVSVTIPPEEPPAP